MKTYMIIIMFILVGAFFIISQENLALKNTENITKFVSLYTAWITGTLDNVSNSVGYVVKLDWLPNQTAG